MSQSKTEVHTQLPTGAHKPRAYYNVCEEDWTIDGSGFKKFLKKNQYEKSKNNHELLQLAGSPCLAQNITWDDDKMEMRFEALPGTESSWVYEAEIKQSFGKDVLVLSRDKVGVIQASQLETISEDNIGRIVKHWICAALLMLGDQTPTNFLASVGDSTLYAIDNSDYRGKFNMDEENFVSLLTPKPLGKKTLMRKLCQEYVEKHKLELKEFIENIPEGALKKSSKSGWENRKEKFLSLL